MILTTREERIFRIAEKLAEMLDQYGRLNEACERIEEEVTDPACAWDVTSKLIHAMEAERIKAVEEWEKEKSPGGVKPGDSNRGG